MQAAHRGSIVPFRDLPVFKAGLAVSVAIAKIAIDAGISITPVRNAYNGTRIQREKAEALDQYAWDLYGMRLDIGEMVAAPKVPFERLKKKSKKRPTK